MHIAYQLKLTIILFITKGDIEEYPALDPVPVYPINIDPVTDEVKITISARVFATMNHHSNQKPLCKASESSNEVVLIIGSGNY